MFRMTETEQSFKNHVKLDPWFHFFLGPLSFVLFIWSLVNLYNHRASQSILISAGFLLLVVLIFKVRIYSLKVQDRVIRLEERLRLNALCDDQARSRIGQLTEGQLIALRFASDAEVPVLARRALDEKLAPKQIKEAVKNWRADHFRV